MSSWRPRVTANRFTVAGIGAGGKMRIPILLWAVAALCGGATATLAAEGSSVAGPIGGTDIRSAQLPPPGLYGGTIQLYAEADKFFDSDGNVVPALRALDLARTRVGPFLLYVPDVRVLGGSVGVAAIVPAGTECGRLFKTTPKRCIAGVGDPYVEVDWSRFFGTIRPSEYPGALPIAEGLTIAAGFGVVIPVGRYSEVDATVQGLTIGKQHLGLRAKCRFHLHDGADPRGGDRTQREALLEQLSHQSRDRLFDGVSH